VAAYTVLIVLLLCAADTDAPTHRRTDARPESWYQARAAAALKGIREVEVDHGRVDVLTVTHAIEVERLEKFKEGIGQALWYSWQTRRKPGLILILPSPSKGERFFAPTWQTIRDQITNHTTIKVWLQLESDGRLVE
jgi:hypothetical protein